MEVLKKCFKCNTEKPRSNFYAHSKMSDGLLGKCKECTKSDARSRIESLQNDEVWIDKERARHREKYQRLGYKQRHKELQKEKPWRREAKLSNVRRSLKMIKKKDIEIHHWSYKEEHFKDFFEIKIRQHRKAHTFIKIDLDLRMYRTLEGVLLDTKESHKKYLESKGIIFES